MMNEQGEAQDVAEQRMRYDAVMVLALDIVWQRNVVMIVVGGNNHHAAFRQVCDNRVMTGTHQIRSRVHALQPAEPNHVGANIGVWQGVGNRILRSVGILLCKHLVCLSCYCRIDILEASSVDNAAEAFPDASPQHSHAQVLPQQAHTTKLAQTYDETIKILHRCCAGLGLSSQVRSGCARIPDCRQTCRCAVVCCQSAWRACRQVRRHRQTGK